MPSEEVVPRNRNRETTESTESGKDKPQIPQISPMLFRILSLSA